MQIDTWIKYTIKKGKHFCNFTWSRLCLRFNTSLAFKCIFSNNCKYDLQDSNQFDVNKLYGLGWGFKGPLYNSYRIGWRYNAIKDKIELFLFIQENKTRTLKYLDAVELNQEFTVRMIVDNNNLLVYLYLQGQQTITASYQFKSIGKILYRCFPYFGGDQTAPDTMNIFIKEII